MAYDLKSLDSGQTLADQSYKMLREAISDGRLAPGEVLTERGLAASLAVSPTPVREALRRLEQDKLIERSGPRTVEVAKFDKVALAEIGMVEDSLKSIAARLAAEKISAAELDVLTAILEDADAAVDALVAALERTGPTSAETRERADQLAWLNRRFHTRINAACGNDVIRHLIENVEIFGLAERKSALRSQVAEGDIRLRERYADHQRILAALRARDAELAAALVEKHNRAARAAFLE
ncbi:MAG: GntR family transcriptional regulator [Propionibacteriaceae bacterium]|jgi:DNA-binding GntR family transcriptional regulator|nr:GntR family transcriptional regulator [Propionibacteriaceae bacterium]